VLSVRKHEVLIDLGPQGVGLVPRREIGYSRTLNEGEEVSASVVDTELESGYVLLSLRKAAKDKGWDEVLAKLESGDVIDVTPYDANRGGLLVEYEGVRGFLPVSQLSAEHYPRVGSNDKDEILQRLNALINQTLKVRILDADRRANKLIFSEKEAIKEGLAARFEKLKVGDAIKGVVTGVVTGGGVDLGGSGCRVRVHVDGCGSGDRC
jgi:small subunit ribosomal protein S1